VISCSYRFDWDIALQEAEAKEAGIDAATIALPGLLTSSYYIL